MIEQQTADDGCGSRARHAQCLVYDSPQGVFSFPGVPLHQLSPRLKGAGDGRGPPGRKGPNSSPWAGRDATGRIGAITTSAADT